ncbi:glycosyltransferase family 2 protein [Ramlibacter monticola]|uniref:Glycosyltransferase n=1 Tax=Ramlibacter monticola TaxID=1926872 RepID=A0A936YXW1_9BURK|nr:glycosyltransferase [Ramlibacter monticola]MBL0391358.1 glycosyltransferase [Ramlibacter monticola]
MADYAITFACYNQVGYTRQCVDSLVRHGYDLGRVVAVDNGSSDETRDYLQTLPLGGRILNRQNLGCGVAWNQGVLAFQAEWSVVMNNDVVVSAGWLENLIAAAEARGAKVVSPGLVEGALDYDFDAFAADASKRLREVARVGARHAVCMAVHRSVWDRVGFFQATPSLWGYEDTLFFHTLERAGIPTAIVGASWLHHYGSVTVSAMKQERGLSAREGLSARNSYRLLGKSMWRRKWDKMVRKRQERQWRSEELARYGMTLHGERRDGQFVWR